MKNAAFIDSFVDSGWDKTKFFLYFCSRKRGDAFVERLTINGKIETNVSDDT